MGAREQGIIQNPAWYSDAPELLTRDSPDRDWQNYFFNKATTKTSYNSGAWYCPPACKEELPKCSATVDLLPAGQRAYGAPALDSFTLSCDECVETPMGRYKADGCTERGLDCYTTLIQIVPCDENPAFEKFHVYADGDVSSRCCNVKTGACG